MRREIYVTAALAGAAVFVLIDVLNLPGVLAAGAGCVSAFVVRGGALAFGWSLASYHSRPGRDPKDIP